MEKKDIKNILKTAFNNSGNTRTVLAALVVLSILTATILLAYQAYVVSSFQDYPEVEFSMSDFVKMNLAKTDDIEDRADLSEEEDLARSIAEELGEGFRDTARRVFSGRYGEYRIKRFLPREKRNLQQGIGPGTMDLAIQNAHDRFKTNSITTLERRLIKLDEGYVDDYADKLTEYLLEAYDEGVKVFSIIKPRTIEEVNVISDIGRSASYRHFNRLYYRQIRSLEKQKRKEGENYRATEKLILYIAAFMTLTIILLGAMVLRLYRVEKRP